MVSERSCPNGCIQRTLVVDWCPQFNPSSNAIRPSSIAINFNQSSKYSITTFSGGLTHSIQSTKVDFEWLLLVLVSAVLPSRFQQMDQMGVLYPFGRGNWSWRLILPYRLVAVG